MIKKAVHSFWSSPLHTEGVERLAGGYPHPRYFWYSFVFSYKCMRELFEEIEFITDEPTKTVVVDQLGLTYDSVSTDLGDALGGVNPHFWNAAKFVAYTRQTRPFVHIDCDAFLWEPLPGETAAAELFGQSAEWYPSHRQYYQEGLEVMQPRLAVIPDFLKRIPADLGNGWALNCGVLGGQNLELIHDYAHDSLNILTCRENTSAWDEIAANSAEPRILSICAVTIEQLNILAWCLKYKVKPQLLLPPESFDEKGVCRSKNFTHLFGPLKTLEDLLLHLERRFERDYPGYKAQIDKMTGFTASA